MKWQAAKYSRMERRIRRKTKAAEWHSKFAFLPVAIPEQKLDSIVTPRHWVWLERYEARRNYGDYGEWELRTYSGAPSLARLAAS